MRDACSLMSIRLLDHIIVNSDGDFFSFLDTGLILG
jgi:DNA repair protein RadC